MTLKDRYGLSELVAEDPCRSNRSRSPDGRFVEDIELTDGSVEVDAAVELVEKLEECEKVPDESSRRSGAVGVVGVSDPDAKGTT